MHKFGKYPVNTNVTGIHEQLKFKITNQLNQFLEDDHQKVLKFDKSLTANERKYIHNYCVQYSLPTKSFGFGPERYLTVMKRTKDSVDLNKSCLTLNQEIMTQIVELKYSLKINLRNNIQPNSRNLVINNSKAGRLVRVEPNVPPINRNDSHYDSFRKTLPIYEYRKEILDTIAVNPVVIISGDTGCGKTTQVPQYLLEYCGLNQVKCRMVCAEPRRLAAISVSERVSLERNEPLGQTVGYQIRLENKTGNRTLLTFCTNGVILRTLMSNKTEFINNLTHIIIDEVHERDRFSDFLLLIMKDVIQRNPNIRLILMSATFNIQKFSDYFGGCPVIEIPGKLYEVKTYYLEDVLRHIDYMSLDMAHYQVTKDKKQRRLMSVQKKNDCVGGSEVYSQRKPNEIDPQLKERMDLCLQNVWVDGSDASFAQLICLISDESSLIDYKHSESGVTALMVASARNKVPIIETLLEYGANINIKTPDGQRAIDWAKRFDHSEVVDFFDKYCLENRIVVEDESNCMQTNDLLTEEEREVLELYHNCFNDDEVDIQLISALIEFVLKNTNSGAILVFLPGFDEILKLKDNININSRRFNPDLYKLFILHSQMQCADQKNVFNSLARGVRKLILSTNIAETSITIDDVVYVIDCGKVKEKSFDALMGIVSLKTVWISQSSVRQRRGRAGRTQHGVCFHLFSKNRFQNMQKHQIPELLRMPIHEVCLQTKLLAPNDQSIHQFLSSSMDPPSIASVRTSVQLLRTIDALTSTEQLTNLGIRLLDLPIEPNFGKMILYSIVLKCLDPVLTIVSSQTFRDPFIIPTLNDRKKILMNIRKKYSLNASSDHIIYLTVFNEWLKVRNTHKCRHFCNENLISNSTMELISGIRQQLYNQLKSSAFIRDNRELNRNSLNWSVIKAALCAGAYPKIIRFDENRGNFFTSKDKIRFHQTSQLSGDGKVFNKLVLRESMPSDWLIYEEVILIGRVSFAKCVTSISPFTVALFCGPNYSSEELSSTSCDTNSLKVDDWISFSAQKSQTEMIRFLRENMHKVFVNRIDSLSKPDNRFDETVIETVVNVLNVSECESGFEKINSFSLQSESTFNTYPHKYQSQQYHSDRTFRAMRSRVRSNRGYNYRP